MNRLHLAQLVDWAGEVKTRKRLQKVVFLLKAAGCPLAIDYSLHHYGPYSQDLARLTDEMVGAGLLLEQLSDNVMNGQSYSYKLSPDAKKQLDQFGTRSLPQFADFETLAKQLLNESLQKLEFASTVAFFKSQGKAWPEAARLAADFKRLRHDGPEIKEAEFLARRVVERQ